MTLTERIRQKAVDLGFDLVGVAPAGEARHAGAFRRWLENGHHGAMNWMARDPERRIDPRRVVPGARSLVMVGVSYFIENPPPEIRDDPSRGRIARYAWGPDYHDALSPRLEELVAFIKQEAGRDVRCRYYIDTGPVLERAWTAEAGQGFIGKNTLLINPQYGSYVFLGGIITDLELDYDEPASDNGATLQMPKSEPGVFQMLPTPPRYAARSGHPSKEGRKKGFPPLPGGVRPATGGTGGGLSDVPHRSRTATCGACRRCLDICPTHAFPAPYVLDGNRCISYLTIELRESIPEELRPLMRNWIFGCDECQSICPWVRRYSRPPEKNFLKYDPAECAPPLLELIELDEEGFRRRFRGTPVLRPKRRGLLRNVAVALGNWGDPAARPALERAARDPEPLIREHAEWALGRM